MSVESIWLPASRCGTGCLPPRGRIGLAGSVLVVLRLVAVVALIALAGLLLPVIAMIRPARWPTMRRLARSLLALLGVQHELRGRPPCAGALVVAIHISWLDIPALLAYMPVRVVAKQQVRRWPMIGWLAAGAGTVFIDRSRPRTLPVTVAQVTAALRRGQPVAVFPEATTWCGKAAGRFRPAMFQAAIDACAPVVPVSLRYRSLDGQDTTAAAFLGEETLISSLLRVIHTPGVRVVITVHAPLHPGPGATRRTLSRACGVSVNHRRPDGHPGALGDGRVPANVP